VRTIAGIAIVILAALGPTVGLTISSSLREEERLMDEFTGTTRQQVHASVEALSARLDALDQDTRMLAGLLERSRSMATADPKAERRVWEAAFHALAVVVAQYRALTFVDADGSIQVLAADPTESQETIAALLQPTLQLRAKYLSSTGGPSELPRAMENAPSCSMAPPSAGAARLWWRATPRSSLAPLPGRLCPSPDCS
jgi:hypothetical protein